MTDTTSQPNSLPEPTTDTPTRFPLERGWRKRALIHDLARMEHTNTALGEKYGVTQSAIAHFKRRHTAEIDEVKRDIEAQFAGLWIAQKVNRLAEYEADVEQLNAKLADEPNPVLLKVKHNALKNVAEELGHLPPRVQVQVGDQVVNYVIEGIDPETLK